MKKIYIFDVLGGLKGVFEYIKQSYQLESLAYVYTPYTHKSSLYYKSLRRTYIASKVGILNFIKSLISKDSIILADHYGHNFNKISHVIIFINHGWGTKKYPGNNEIKNEALMNIRREMFMSVSYIICLSEFDATYFGRHPYLDDLKRPKFLPFGLPRNDFLVKNKNNMSFREELLRMFQLNENCKLILYAPTHREMDELNAKLLSRILHEFEKIDHYLKEKKMVILFRPHYYTSGIEREIKRFQNIFYVGYDKFGDPRPLLLGCNYLLTDYSSIFVDYLLLQKPVVFYPFDLEEYETLRGLVIDFKNKIHTPGPKINSLEELLELSDADFKDFDLNTSMCFFHKYSDGRSTERISEFLINRISGGN